MGDGESMEGNVWEALNFAGFYKLDNLVAIIDVNRLGQSDPTPLQHDMNTYKYVPMRYTNTNSTLSSLLTKL